MLFRENHVNVYALHNLQYFHVTTLRRNNVMNVQCVTAFSTLTVKINTVRTALNNIFQNCASLLLVMLQVCINSILPLNLEACDTLIIRAMFLCKLTKIAGQTDVTRAIGLSKFFYIVVQI